MKIELNVISENKLPGRISVAIRDVNPQTIVNTYETFYQMQLPTFVRVVVSQSDTDKPLSFLQETLDSKEELISRLGKVIAYQKETTNYRCFFVLIKLGDDTKPVTHTEVDEIRDFISNSIPDDLRITCLVSHHNMDIYEDCSERN